MRCTTGPTPFQRRGCGLPSGLLGPRGAFTECRRTSDALLVTRRHARVGLRTARCAVRDTLLADGATRIDLRAEGPGGARPVKVERSGIRERLPSCRDPSSSRSKDGRAANLVSAPRNLAPFRHLSTRALRQAVLRASSRLAPSRSTRPCDLPVRKTRDASNRLLPPEQVTCTRSPYVPGSLGPLSRSGMPRDDPWSSRGMTEGPGVFTTPETASAPSPSNACPRALCLAASGHERGPVRPAALDGTRPLTPLSRIPLSLRAHAPSCVRSTTRCRGSEE